MCHRGRSRALRWLHPQLKTPIGDDLNDWKENAAHDAPRGKGRWASPARKTGGCRCVEDHENATQQRWPQAAIAAVNRKEKVGMTPDRENIRFNVLRNALYHTARRRALERWNRSFNFLVIILGAAAFGDALQAVNIPGAWAGLAVAVIGALQLVFDFGRQARDHQTLQRDYYTLLADIEATPADDPEKCAEWYSAMIRITADEPPVFRAIDAKAYNDALDATEAFDRSERLVVPLMHRVLSGVFAFEGFNYPKECEKRAGTAPTG